MTPEQMQLLRDTAASDKGNVVCIAILNLLQLVEDKDKAIVALQDRIRLMKEAYE